MAGFETMLFWPWLLNQVVFKLAQSGEALHWLVVKPIMFNPGIIAAWVSRGTLEAAAMPKAPACICHCIPLAQYRSSSDLRFAIA